MKRSTQQDQLPVTSSSEIIESKGMEAYMWFIVFMMFVIINKACDLMGSQNGTPIAAVTCGVLWICFKLYLRNKPPKFLQHLFEYFALKKRFSHYCKGQDKVIAD